ncbi:MAG: Enamidase, partial [Hyphomicrobiales bacterium]|nr:Enamidase [Hyphomicrobiales bacterium]
MAVEVAGGPMKGKLVLRNISTLFSGELSQPVLDADTIVAIDGRISGVGREKDLDTQEADLTIDAKGSALAP